MDKQYERLENANRLSAICAKIGFALWQLQELEGMTATFFVLKARVKPDTGMAAGTKLLEKELRKTFGNVLHSAVSAKIIPSELVSRFQGVLKDRNWLVHGSRSSDSAAAYDDNKANVLIARLDAIATEAHSLMKALGRQAEKHVSEMGVSREKIEEMALSAIEKWRRENGI